MKNSENINHQANESNSTQEKKQNNSKTIGIVLLIIGLLLLGVGGYKLFIEKGDKPNEKENSTPTSALTPTPSNTQENDGGNESIDNSNRIKINENNTDIEFNDKIIKLRTVDYVLYIDDKRIDSLDLNIIGAYVTDNFILLEAEGQNYWYPYAINKNYDLIEVNGNPDTPTCAIENISEENGKVIATKSCYDDFNEGENDYEIKVEFVYETNQITIKELH